MERKQLRVALYPRVSTEEQKKHGYSIQAQLSELREYASYKNYLVIGEYIDEGYSGGTLKRPALQRLLQDVRADKLDLIIFVKLDRWFRSVAQYYKIQEVLEAHNVNWECTQEDYETITSSGKFKVNIMLSVSQQFKDATSERIKSVFDYKVKNGYYTARSLPFGFKLKKVKGGNRVIKNPKEEAAVNDFFDKFEESHSLRYTQRYINNKYEIELGRKRVDTLFNSDLMHGEYKGIENFCEPYLTKERHLYLLEIRNKYNIKENVSKYDYIFSGLIKCPHCGRLLVGSKHYASCKKYQYPIYRCNKAFVETNNCDYKRYLYESTIEKNVISDLTAKLKRYIDNASMNSNLDLFTLEKNDLLSQLSNLNMLFQRGRITEEEYNMEYEIVNRQLQILIEENTSQFITLYNQLTDESLYNYYYKLPNLEKRSIMKSIIKSIEVTDDRKFTISYINLL